MKLIFVIWILTIIIYFLSLRIMIKKSIDIDIDDIGDTLKIIVIGFVPIVNMIFIIAVLIDYLQYECRIDGEKLLKKLLFIKDKEVDERWR